MQTPDEKSESNRGMSFIKHIFDKIPKREDFKRFFSFARLLFSLNYTKVDIALIIVGTFFAIAAGVPEPLLGIVLGQLINELNEVSCSASVYDPSSVRTKVLYLIYITIFNFASIYIYASCWALVSERIARRYRKAYFRSVIRQEAAFHDKLPSGQVISRLVSDVETLQSGTSEKVGIYLATLSYFVTAYVVAFIKVPIIAGILIAAIPCFFAMALVGGHLAARYGARVTKHVDLATSIASSSLSHLKIVHAFNAQKRLEDLFSGHLIQSRKDAIKKAAVHAAQMGTLFFIVYSSNALAYWKGAHLIADSVDGLSSGVSVGAVYTVIFILIDATFIFSQVSPYMHVFSAATSASERLMEVINRDSAIDGTSRTGEDSANLGDAETIFKDIEFSYPARSEMPVLQGLSLSIPPKQHTAIVGPSGGGKSTIVALLERFYDPSSGTIHIGDQNIQSLNVASLRGQMGFVQQESQLLDRSIVENIAYGLVGTAELDLAEAILDMSLTEVVTSIQSGISEDQALATCDSRVTEIFKRAKVAADRANALSFIEYLAFGIASPVGTSGSQLSGGQRQRIALATALIREPKMLILDEATAALDSMSEQLIQSSLQKLAGTATIVSIAHRLAAVQDADQIIVIQNGRLVECGSPQHLLQSGGAYSTMINQQKLDNAEFDNIRGSLSDDNSSLVLEKHDAISKETAVDKEKSVYLAEEKGGIHTQTEDDPATPAEEPRHSKRVTAKICFAFIRPNILLILLGLAMSVIIGASYSSNAILFGNTVGGLSPCKGTANIRYSGNLFGGMFFMVGFVELFANVIGGCAYGWAADQILYRLRLASLRSLLSQSMTWHSAEGRTPGLLIAYITGDASAISGLTGTTIGLLLATGVNLFAGIIISFVVAWKISIVLVPTIPILLLAGFMKLRVQGQFAERHKKAFSRATEITVEALGNLRFVAGFSLENQLYREFLSAIQKPYKNTTKAIAWGNFWLAWAFSVSNLISALAYWWGSKQIASGLYSQTQFFIVLPALLFSTQSCGQMLALAPDLSKAGKSASRIVDLVKENSAEQEHAGDRYIQTIPVDAVPGKDTEANVSADTTSPSSSLGPVGAMLNQVSFSYPKSSHITVLNELSVDFRPGGFYALVGPSGSGKSTIFSMLERFYKPSSGSVVINGQDINRVLATSFRDDIALVPQENVLFEGTLAFNIGLGARVGHIATQTEIEEACKLAQIHDVIMRLPEGYETFCTHDGKQFSGGQRQRLSIARALVRKPGLLLLDESTSALDGESERKIQDALAALSGKTTIIAIAHRLKTIYRANQIFLIQDGSCVDRGTHAELVERSEMYRESVLHQSLAT
ncbi:ABC transporter integral membrane type 1 [Penicillium brevicompactum]|uniref:ABC transporter integral membrane type 1 n=1 Tax=Penicillium brevicompactum TaxID=5074 RepID=UPI002540F7D5|nr:ABC transporter integral membrane type 1 [Penicillium brevicompactum]KAJ5333433.1 ABC transporter integral membrane type 1 [Penicillium brevicompactum]